MFMQPARGAAVLFVAALKRARFWNSCKYNDFWESVLEIEQENKEMQIINIEFTFICYLADTH